MHLNSNCEISLFQGTVIYDDKFSDAFSTRAFDQTAVKELCTVCKYIANNTELVKPNGAQCIPTYGKLQTNCNCWQNHW